jgi:oxygen-independent coproporphyrinogen-3 oxidase
MKNSLIQKYNVPGPRYTSYPTVPYWNEEGFLYEDWIETFKKSFIESNSTEGISLYIHLPFCESLCTFCGCNKRITKNHSGPYIANYWMKNLLLRKFILEEAHQLSSQLKILKI